MVDENEFDILLNEEVIKKYPNKSSKEIAKTLITEELQRRYNKGITKASELPADIKHQTVVLMEDTERYPQGFGVLTKSKRVKALWSGESSDQDGDFQTYGDVISKNNKLLGILGIPEFAIVDPSINQEPITTPEENSEIIKTAEEVLGQEFNIAEFTNENNNITTPENPDDWSNLGEECK